MDIVTLFRTISSALLLLNVGCIYAAEQLTSIEIGIAPFLPVKTLVQNYAPMRDYLEAHLKVPVTIVSAHDYKTFYRRIRSHDYPVIITPANSAYLAWAESAYVPLLKPVINTRPAVVVAKGKSLAHISDLRGKTVTMSDALSMVSMQSLQMMREAGLEPGRNITVLNMPNHSVAVNMLLAGEVDAAIVSDRSLMQMPHSIRERISVAYTWNKGAAPGVIYLGSPDISPDRLQQIKSAIVKFSKDTPEGVQLIKNLGYGKLTTIEPEELESLAHYGLLLKEAVNGD